MEEKLKVEGSIYKVEKGQTVLVKIGNSLFKYAGEVHEEQVKSNTIFVNNQRFAVPSKGKPIGRKGNTVFYENIYRDIEQAMNKNITSREDLAKIIKLYYPKFTKPSAKAIASFYRRLVGGLFVLEPYEQISKTRTYKPRLVSSPKTSELDKGKVLGYVYKIRIYSNIYNDCKSLLEKGATKKQLRHIIKAYYPKMKRSRSYVQYANAYYKAITGERKLQKSGDYIPTKKKTSKAQYNKGRRLGVVSNLRIYENIYNDIKNSERTINAASKIVKTYYPKYKLSSARSYGLVYLDIISGKRKLEQTEQTKIKKSYKQKRRRKPKDAVGFSKSYYVHVTNEDVAKVKNALGIVEYNYKPTLPELLKRTKLSHNRLLGTLDVLKTKKEVEIVRHPGERMYYQLVNY